MFEFCRKTGRNLSTNNELPLPIVKQKTASGKSLLKAPHARHQYGRHAVNIASKAACRRRSNRLVSEWSGVGTAVLLAQVEEIFKRLSVAPVDNPPNSVAPHGFVEQGCPATLSSSPIPQPRKFLVPKGSARGSSTLVIPFLHFPAEIRLQIYSNFLFTTPEKVWQPCDRKEQHERLLIKVSRKNLRRVCHQISGEWDPLFFSNTTITARNLHSDWDSLSVPSIGQNRPLTNFADMWHKGAEMIYNLPQMRPMGSELLRQSFLERQPHYKLNRIRRLQYVISGSSVDSMDLEDLKSFARVIQGTGEEALQWLEEVAICYRPLNLVGGYVTVDNVWGKCSEWSNKWDKVKSLFQPGDELGCFREWAIIRRICFDKKLVPSYRTAFNPGVKVYELQLVFRKSQQPTAAVNSEWMELPGDRAMDLSGWTVSA
ncbi:hypothetical protein CLAIMM_05702 [Cladophialophora immunda]|nr:hypothetical protein CLAIMM_05702 [Cladophialophora immunda]